MSEIAEYVEYYYDKCLIPWPETPGDALAVIGTEWITATDHEEMIREFGDAILSLVVAGIVIGGDPIDAMCTRIIEGLGLE